MTRALAFAVAVLVLSSCGGDGADAPPGPTPTSGSSPPRTLVAVGDIGRCDLDGDEQTAALVAAIGDDATLAPLGDIAYFSGLTEEFARCYDPSWGPFKERTRPVPGNHEYGYFKNDAAAYFQYFDGRAGPEGLGYYSYDLGSWHVVALNSNCDADALGGCGPESPQVRWLREDLARSDAACTLAYWHHPRFSSGSHHGSDDDAAAFWDALYDAGADVVLSGHEHNYQRFAPQTPRGERDPVRGIRAFVVGTGGADLYPLGEPLPATEAQDATTLGILVLDLRDGGYDWRFEPVENGGFRDSGSATCH